MRLKLVAHLGRRSPHGERGLKCSWRKVWVMNRASLSSRRAWIEIATVAKIKNIALVALLTESVDWNLYCTYIIHPLSGRSPHGERGLKCTFLGVFRMFRHPRLLSSRRAWIEISIITTFDNFFDVALLTESVDWNHWSPVQLIIQLTSLSSRRAWIEIYWSDKDEKMITGRSPHGERGLKWNGDPAAKKAAPSLSSRRAWIEI